MGLLDLDMDERRLVTRILERAFLELRSEIWKTDAPAMKDELKREEVVLGRVLEKLGVHKQPAVTG
jgi:hypothetical protein